MRCYVRAFVKKDKWVNFLATSMHYGFSSDENPKTNESFLARVVHGPNKLADIFDVFLIITMDRELHIVTPFGESPFMETHEAHFKDLIDDDLIEYVKGEFD